MYTKNNIDFVRKQIELKNSPTVYYATSNDVEKVVTDFDHFPYTRFYRGQVDSHQPVVIEREAGWRPVQNSCYSYHGCSTTCRLRAPYPRHCFEAPCSTVYPCYPSYLDKETDRDAINVQLNRTFITQHR